MNDAQPSEEKAVRGGAAAGGVDRNALVVHSALPVAVASVLARLLAPEWSWTLFVAILLLAAVAFRPAAWALSSALTTGGERHRRAYRERLRAVANTSLVVAAILGLAIMDVFQLPGAPLWTNQPMAGLSLAGVAVYLVWLATYADVPREVGSGWRTFFESRRSA